MGRYHSGPHGSVHPGVRGHRWYPENHGEMFTISSPWKLITRRRILCNDCDNAGIQILFICKLLEFLKFIRFNQTAIRSCDSEMASSVPDKPLYFTGTLSRSILNPSAISTYCDTHTAGTEVICLFDSFVAFGLRNNLLQLTLDWRISLLNLAGTFCKRGIVYAPYWNRLLHRHRHDRLLHQSVRQYLRFPVFLLHNIFFWCGSLRLHPPPYVLRHSRH